MQFKAEVVDDGSRRTLLLAGRLEREQASELVLLYDQTHGADRLDLTDLMSADAAGLDTLRMLRSRGAGLVGLTPYLALQMDAGASEHMLTPLDDIPGVNDATRHTVMNKRSQENR
jgi:ABC-type transporter Mla MlaB component